jgi:hypothetical protein
MAAVGLARSWLGGSLRVAGATLVVPAALFAALLVVIVGGSLGGLGALRHALDGSGTAVTARPAAAPAPVAAPGGAGTAPAAPVRDIRPAVTRAVAPATAPDRSSRRGARRSPGAERPGPTTTGDSGSSASQSAPGAGGSGSGGVGSNPASGRRGLLGQATQPVRDVAGQLPSPVGAQGIQVLDTVTQTGDGIITPPPASSSPASPAAPALPVGVSPPALPGVP